MTWARRSIRVDETKQRPPWAARADLLINIQCYEQIKSGKLLSSKPPPPVLSPPFPGKRVHLVQVRTELELAWSSAKYQFILNF